MALFGLTDEPLGSAENDRDHLSMGKYAKGLAQFAANCETPMTIGIQGEWGSGKTSLMKLVLEELNTAKLTTHWFDTWKYGALDSSENLGLRLMTELTSKIADGAINTSTWKIGASILSAVGKSVLAATTSKVTAGIMDGQTLVSGLAQVGTDNITVPDMREKFSELVQNVTAGEGKKNASRLVVFIDDLDRIRPARAVALLEVLKNFMDVKNTVFIVACDYSVVQEGVKETMGITDKAKVEAFFHKIFQLPFEMPCNTYSVEPALRDWILRQADLSLATKGKASKDPRWEKLSRILSPVVRSSIGTNPRALKRFLNTIELASAIHESSDPPPSPIKTADDAALRMTSIIGLHAVQSRWPEIGAYLFYDIMTEDKQARAAERFERALRTLADYWDGWSKIPSFPDSANWPDEQIYSLLRRSYSTPPDYTNWQAHREVEELRIFARAWFEALDSDESGKNNLSSQELSMLRAWCTNMKVRAPVTLDDRDTWASEIRQRHPAHGDAFVGLAQEVVEDTCKNHSATLSYTFSPTKFEVRLALPDGSKKPLLSFDSSKGDLAIQIKSAWDDHFKRQGLRDRRERFAQEAASCGFELSTTPGSWYSTINFTQRRAIGSERQLQQMSKFEGVFRSFLDDITKLETKQ
jgi:hypothetical protein